MKLSFKKIAVTLGLTIAMSLGAQSSQAADINPFNFNVYSLSDIGSTTTGYGSDYQGIAGAAGSAYFTNFSLNDLNQSHIVTGFSLVTGGDAAIAGSINNGGIEAGGDVYINNASVFGNVNAGGSLNGPGGTVYGNATLGGSDNTTSSVTVTGSVSEGASFTSSLNFAGINSFLTSYSANINGQADTGSYTNSYGELIINAASGDNYITIDGSTLNSAWGVTINGAADSVVYINVDGTVVSLDSTNWVYNGLDSGDVLLNFGDATTLALTGGNTVNMLAPLADTNFAYGLVTGNLIVGNLTGGGQVNLGGFEHNVVPEPTSAMVLLGSVMALTVRRSRRRRIV